MVEGAKRTLEAVTGKTVVSTGDPATESLGDSKMTMRVSNDVEFAVVFESGRVFYTAGFEEAKTLEASIELANEIAGSYSPAIGAWCRTLLPGAIESIIDLRLDTSDE